MCPTAPGLGATSELGRLRHLLPKEKHLLRHTMGLRGGIGSTDGGGSTRSSQAWQRWGVGPQRWVALSARRRISLRVSGVGYDGQLCPV